MEIIETLNKHHIGLSNKRKSVAFWFETALAISSGVPLVEKYITRNESVIIYTDSNLLKHCKRVFLGKNVTVIDFTSGSRIQKRIGAKITYNIFIPFFISPQFSSEYSRQQKRSMSKRQRALNKALSFLHLPNHEINKRYHDLFRLFYWTRLFKNIFKEKEIQLLIVFTPSYYPFYLTPVLKKMLLVVESWDHPPKRPFLINPKKCLVWNQDLKRETQKYQYFESISFIRPTKFNYIDKRNNCTASEMLQSLTPKQQEDINYIKNKKTIVYPVCLSLHRLKDNSEISFIKYLAELTNRIGLQFYIRPYPLAPETDIKILSEIKNAKVGSLPPSANINALLSDEELNYKFLILKYAHLVINIGTTFVFDAAYSGTNILQVNINSNIFGSGLKKVSNYSHINKYLNTSQHCFKFSSYEDEDELVSRIILSDDTHSQSMRKWLQNKK